jgi:hypothetical protein
MSFHKVLVINAKGGSGKSTVSTQVILPWLYLHTGKQYPSFYYEFDDENRQKEWAFQATTVAINKSAQVSQTELRDRMADILLQKENSVCIDVGANKTSIAIQEALFDSGMIHAIDVAVIPVMDGEIDAVNAITIAKDIRSVSDVPVVFALGRQNLMRELKSQFNIFLGDDRSFLQQDGLIEQLPEKDRQYFIMPDSDAIKYSRLFGVTLWEVGQVDKDFNKEIREAMRNGADADEIKFLSFKKGVYRDCVAYNDDVLIPAFSLLDAIIGKVRPFVS